MNSRKEGISGEELAIAYLKKQGLKVVEQNVRMTVGEIDVVCYDGDVLVFVEVKTRSTLAFGDPLEAIDRRKVQKYRKMAEEYIVRHRLFDKDVRFDAVGIVGDSVHSRVVGSLAPALVKMGAEVTLVGPGPFLPARPDVLGAKSARDFDALLPDLDVVYMLRVQQERMEGASIPSTRDYSLLFGLDERRAKLMAPQAVVMHPGPINRGVEMCSQVADAANSLITSQVNAGVSVRMAVIYLLLGGEGNVVA